MKNFKKGTFSRYLSIVVFMIIPLSCDVNRDKPGNSERAFNGPYENEYLNRVAFPMGFSGSGN